jgi:hypothetical protein
MAPKLVVPPCAIHRQLAPCPSMEAEEKQPTADEKCPYMVTYVFQGAADSTQANAVSFNLDKRGDATDRWCD